MEATCTSEISVDLYGCIIPEDRILYVTFYHWTGYFIATVEKCRPDTNFVVLLLNVVLLTCTLIYSNGFLLWDDCVLLYRYRHRNAVQNGRAL
jgi:hypothetical protein